MVAKPATVCKQQLRVGLVNHTSLLLTAPTPPRLLSIAIHTLSLFFPSNGSIPLSTFLPSLPLPSLHPPFYLPSSPPSPLPSPPPSPSSSHRYRNIERSNLLAVTNMVVKGLIETAMSAGKTVTDNQPQLQQFLTMMEYNLTHRLKRMS